MHTEGKTVTTTDLNGIDSSSYINKKCEAKFYDGDNIVEARGVQRVMDYDASNPTSRLLATTTVTNPVCHRYDSATSSWTTNGVTTVDNGSSVSCTTTEPGAVMVHYISTTTTTPEPTTSSSDSNVGLIVGLVVALVVVAVGVTLTIIFVKKAQKKRK